MDTLAKCACGKHYWVYAFRVGAQDRCPRCRAKAEAEANQQEKPSAVGQRLCGAQALEDAANNIRAQPTPTTEARDA